MALTGKQRRHLRALAHKLHPIVQIGKGGLDDGLIAAVDQALTDHELIKVKVGNGSDLGAGDTSAELAARTHSDVAGVIGSTVMLYRAHPDEPRIVLPAARANPAAPLPEPEPSKP